MPVPTQPKRKKLTVGEVFNQDDDDASEVKKKRKLVPLDFEDDKKPVSLSLPGSSKPTTAEEKRKCIKNLIERIPTAKDDLFSYPLDWNMVDAVSSSVTVSGHTVLSFAVVLKQYFLVPNRRSAFPLL